MENKNVNYAELINGGIDKLGISREMLHDALDGEVSKCEMFDFLGGKLLLPRNAIDSILCLLEDIEFKRVTRDDPVLVISRTRKVVQASRPESHFMCGKRYLDF